MNTLLTIDNVRTALRKAVALRGEDYVYTDTVGRLPEEDARYVYVNDDGTPGCILGCALLELGVPAEAFHAPYFGGAVSDKDINGVRFTQIADKLPIEFDEQHGPWIYSAMKSAQELQDDGATWGTALQAAEHALDRGQS